MKSFTNTRIDRLFVELSGTMCRRLPYTDDGVRCALLRTREKKMTIINNKEIIFFY